MRHSIRRGLAVVSVGLTEGNAVTSVVKATEVKIATPQVQGRRMFG